jgi:enterochelin esterase-like enzyme
MRAWPTSLAAALAAALASCQPEPAAPAPAGEEAPVERVTVTIVATVPEDAGPIYLAGNVDAIGPWRADGRLMEGEGRTRTTTLALPDGFALEFKLTGGSWEREGTGPSGTVLPNFRHTVRAGQGNRVEAEIVDFKRPPEAYLADPEGAGALGTLIHWTDVESAFFDVTRHVSIWLPPGYETGSERRYPVVYMHDGQNLFDPRIANTGTDWGVDEAMMRNVEAGLHAPAIVVGVWSTNIRGYELSPWHGGADYAAMLIEEIMPRVNAEFATLTGPENTFTMGSSMGGLISFYLVRSHPEAFSACGCVSTHVPLSPGQAADFLGLDADPARDRDTPYLVADAQANAPLPEGVRLYLDYGSATLDETYPPLHDALRPWLEAQGFTEADSYAMREFPGAPHNEAAWRERVHLQLAWLLGGVDPNSLD